MCSLDGQLGYVSLTYVADYRNLEVCCTSLVAIIDGAVQSQTTHILNLYCNSFFLTFAFQWRYTTMIDYRCGFA